jgi:hypothetical protein
MEVQTHSFRRPDGSTLTISTTTGKGLSVVEMVEEPAQEPAMEPSDEVQS